MKSSLAAVIYITLEHPAPSRESSPLRHEQELIVRLWEGTLDQAAPDRNQSQEDRGTGFIANRVILKLYFVLLVLIFHHRF